MSLPPVEAAIVAPMLRHFGQLTTCDEIVESAWPDGQARSLNSRIRVLRQRLATVGLQLLTVRARVFVVDYREERRAGRAMSDHTPRVSMRLVRVGLFVAAFTALVVVDCLNAGQSPHWTDLGHAPHLAATIQPVPTRVGPSSLPARFLHAIVSGGSQPTLPTLIVGLLVIAVLRAPTAVARGSGSPLAPLQSCRVRTSVHRGPSDTNRRFTIEMHRQARLLPWPAARANERAALIGRGRPCVWMVEEGASPPADWTDLEDWIRLPADRRDIDRLAAGVEHGLAH